MTNIMQGDAYSVPFEIKCDGGLADESMFKEIEVIIGPLRKTKSAGEVTYNQETKEFSISFTQEETLKMSTGAQSAQLRVKTKDGDVIGVPLGKINLAYSMSKEVL